MNLSQVESAESNDNYRAHSNQVQVESLDWVAQFTIYKKMMTRPPSDVGRLVHVEGGIIPNSYICKFFSLNCAPNKSAKVTND